jgi:hypothetical protein
MTCVDIVGWPCTSSIARLSGEPEEQQEEDIFRGRRNNRAPKDPSGGNRRGWGWSRVPMSGKAVLSKDDGRIDLIGIVTQLRVERV